MQDIIFYNHVLSLDSLIIPPEILGLILVRMGSNVVSNYQTLSAVNSRIKSVIYLVLPHVKDLTISEYEINSCPDLVMFSGVRRLCIYRFCSHNINVEIFNSNVWSNLVSLIIPSTVVHLINTVDNSNIHNISIKTVEPYLAQNNLVLDCQKVTGYDLNYPDCQKVVECRSSYKYSMPRLVDLRIDDEIHTITSFSPSVVPRLQNLILNTCMLRNIGEFKSLRSLEISNAEICPSKLNMLNISRLKLNNIHGFISGINISSLKSLILEYVELADNCLTRMNIVELQMINVHVDNMSVSDIKSLRSLKLERTNMSMYSLNRVHSQSDLHLTSLIVMNAFVDTVVRCNSLKNLVLDHAGIVHIQELPNIETISLTNSSISLTNLSEMKFLTSLSVIRSKNIHKCFHINRIICPNLRILNIDGMLNNLDISLDGMNIMFKHNPRPIIYNPEFMDLSDDDSE